MITRYELCTRWSSSSNVVECCRMMLNKQVQARPSQSTINSEFVINMPCLVSCRCCIELICLFWSSFTSSLPWTTTCPSTNNRVHCIGQNKTTTKKKKKTKKSLLSLTSSRNDGGSGGSSPYNEDPPQPVRVNQ